MNEIVISFDAPKMRFKYMLRYRKVTRLENQKMPQKRHAERYRGIRSTALHSSGDRMTPNTKFHGYGIV